MIASIECQDCPYTKTCMARLNDRTVTGCGVALFISGLIKYDEIGVEHTVNAPTIIKIKKEDDKDGC